MPFFQGTTYIIISGGIFNNIPGNLMVTNTSEYVLNFNSHNTNGVEVESFMWHPASWEDTLPAYDNPNNFPTGTQTLVATAASAPTSTPTQQPAKVMFDETALTGEKQ
ncbi:uncharacterized protein LACBIDRAFT_331881 [Laccaria bicolor S238N-H82]|uniref:Predicted protein n=1 Tax=Laccaria bicolor (strain S238N-H82 / ATCC MYA-4686) TaxID=486041 RepID=B0DQV3_LACBS|nr:uncharacterized protein LACBIDRAFT_331881 [Laccaria bicolor S238N-H82]EDR03183.1 predicted protein [Laccaria bicolor S238N-H82]|eukprot:XP_001886324.1 predicted protein [Laccaria bicolor S238N-H82]